MCFFLNRIQLNHRNFTLEYDTNIPRQVGLAGSSAIVTATLKCLMDFFDITEQDMPKEIRPKFILDVEKEELKINAGLQDRVVQVYKFKNSLKVIGYNNNLTIN